MRVLEKREGAVNITSRGGGEVTIDETYNFIVQADSKFDDRLTVASCPGLPIVGVSLSAAGLAICKSKQGTRREENPILWDFVCSFSSEVDEDSDQNQQPPGSNPETWVPVRKMLFERREEMSFVDQAGSSIANSAGQPFDTGIVRVRFLPVWEFSQFESASITDEQMLDRNETVNSATFKGKAAKTLLLTIVDSTLGFYYGQRRRLTTYRLTYNSRDWRQKRLDVGTVYKSGSDYLPYVDKSGNVILGALDGSGGKQAVGTAPAIRNFDQYATNSFSFLRI